MMNLNQLVQNNQEGMPKVVDCIELSEKLADELFKSPLREKLKIISIDLMFGSGGIYTDNKFSIKIDGKIEKEDSEELNYLKNRFIQIAEALYSSRKTAEDLIKFFWDVKVTQQFEAGSKLNSIEGCFNIYGNKNKIEHEEGRVMLIDIWATWCGYCKKPMDENVQIYRELKDSYPNIDVIAISCDADNDHRKWVDFLKTNKWTELQHYRNKNIMQYFGLESIPHIFIINQEGKIFYSGHPSKINIKDTLKKLANIGQSNNNIESGSAPTEEKLTVEKQILTKEDPNPHWLNNAKLEREEICNTINDIIQGKGVDSVKFAVSTKILYSNGKRKSYTQPILTGYINQEQYESVQEIAIMVSEDFGIKDVQYNVKLIG
jgi:thiol-disulfide isomerase/thioredoxin